MLGQFWESQDKLATLDRHIHELRDWLGIRIEEEDWVTLDNWMDDGAIIEVEDTE